MQVSIHNTLARGVEPFVPLDPEGRVVTFYACGPTVYDYAHIGNFRSFLTADVLRRVLELAGFDVRQVMNITDVGHMTDDANPDGGGEDKMEAARSRLLEDKKAGHAHESSGVDSDDPTAIADFYANAFLEDARRLGLRIAGDQAADPECMPRPTAFIAPMIELVERLIAGGHAYVAGDGVVYFDVQSFPAYGELSGNTPDAIRSGEGGRVDMGTQAVKRHPADFMLWKPDPTHRMRWPSPWGEGYPGWHLECSVMAAALLGAQTGGRIDIHTGGEDNIFPHHECEIAQSCAGSGHDVFARYWLHTRFLLVDGEKMSKSRGTFHTVRDLLERGASPAAIRLELIRTHYRSNASFTMQGLRDSQRQVDRWRRCAAWLAEHADVPREGPGPFTAAMSRFEDALGSDLNVAGAIGVLSEATGSCPIDAPPEPAGAAGGAHTWGDELAALRRMDSVIGVLDLEHEAVAASSDLDVALVEAKIAERNDARARRDWGAADKARDELVEMGVAIKDGPEGTTWTRALDDE